MTVRFRLAQIVFVVALVTALGATTAARDDDAQGKDSKKSDSRSDSRDRDDRDNDRNSDRKDNDRRDNDRDDDRRDNDRDHDDDDDNSHHGKKVTICHREDRRSGGKTITVSASAVAAHQLHGDTLGACSVSACR